MAGISTDFWGSRDWVYLLEAELFDPENRNWLSQSLDLSDTDFWLTSNLTPAASAKTDPDGGTDAWKLTKGNVAATDRIWQAVVRGSQTPGVVSRIALQADSASSPHERCAIRFNAGSVPTSAELVYGPGVLVKDGSGFLVSGLSASQWTEVELVWSMEDNPTLPATLNYELYPGGAATNAAVVHVFLPHFEDELPPNGLGLRSRGARRTTAITNGPGGADGQAVTVRVGTDGYITRPSDTPANAVYRDGLIAPPTERVKAGGPDNLLLGIAETDLGNFQIANPDGTWDHVLALDWPGRVLKLYRGEPGAAFADFELVRETSSEGIDFDLDIITGRPRDPLSRLEKVMPLPRFAGWGSAVRLDGANDLVTIGESPAAWILGDLTVEARVRMYAVQPIAVGCVVSYGDPGGTAAVNNAFNMELDSTNFRMRVTWEYGTDLLETVTSANGSIPSADFTDGRWHHIGFIRDDAAKTISFYWDGSIVHTATYTNSASGGWDGKLRLGLTGIGDDRFKGDIDEVRIWAKVRTEDELLATASRPVDPADYWDQGLRAYYRCDEAIGLLTFEEVTKLDERRMNECHASFTGASNSYGRIAHHADIEPAGDFTLEVRCAAADVAAVEYLLQKDSAYRVFWARASGHLRASIHTTPAAAWQNLSSLQGYTPGQDGLVLLSLRWNNTTKEFAAFLDGGNKATATLAGESITGGTNDLFLAATAATVNNSRVWISEIRYFSEAVSDANIAARASSVLSGDESGLKLWVTFDEARAKREALSISDQGTADTEYAETTLYDRQWTSAAKKSTATLSNATLENTTGELQQGARFVGTGEGDSGLIGQRKRYISGLARHVELIEIDPMALVYFAGIGPLESFEEISDGGGALVSAEISAGDDVWDSDFRQAPSKVYCRYGTAWNDETTDAGDDSAHDGDVQILHATPGSGAVHDGLYVGFTDPATQMDLWMHTVLGQLASDLSKSVVIEVQFWNGEDWETFRVVIDGTRGFRLAGDKAWSADDAITSRLRSVYTKTDAATNHWNGVGNVRWKRPQTWVRESLNDIHTAMGVGGLTPSDATDRWWVRMAITSNPTGYDQAPRLSAIWVTELDVVTDKAHGFVRFASPPLFKPTATIKGDSTGGWAETPAQIAQQAIDRWIPNAGFTYSAGFATQGLDVEVGQVAEIGSDVTMANFLRPVFQGARSLLYTDRAGDLAIATLGAPESASIDETLSASRDHILFLGSIQGPLPATEVDYGFRPYFTRFTERELNPGLPPGERKDLLAELRWISRAAGFGDNAARYLEAEPQEVQTLVGAKSTTGSLGPDDEAAEWAAMLGDRRRRFFRVAVPLGIVEDDMLRVVELLDERLNGELWDGVSSTGRALYIMERENDFVLDVTVLLLWG